MELSSDMVPVKKPHVAMTRQGSGTSPVPGGPESVGVFAVRPLRYPSWLSRLVASRVCFILIHPLLGHPGDLRDYKNQPAPLQCLEVPPRPVPSALLR